MRSTKSKKRSKVYRRSPIRKRLNSKYLIIGMVLCLGLLLVILEATNVTHIFHKTSPVTTATTAQPSTKNQPRSNDGASSATKSPSQSTTSPSPKSTTPTKVSSGGSASGATLIAPYGRFVSYSKPPSVNTVEQSACSTSPGATCVILFTMGSQTISLGSKVTDASGTASWQWTPSGEGLASGSWTIEAKATLDGQTKITKPSTKLMVP